MNDWYRWEGEDLLLRLRVQPRARRNELADIQESRLRVRITAVPLEGKANRHLTRFLAEAFGVRPNQVSLESGEASRNKRVRIRSPRRRPPGIGLD